MPGFEFCKVQKYTPLLRGFVLLNIFNNLFQALNLGEKFSRSIFFPFRISILPVISLFNCRISARSAPVAALSFSSAKAKVVIKIRRKVMIDLNIYILR